MFELLCVRHLQSLQKNQVLNAEYDFERKGPKTFTDTYVCLKVENSLFRFSFFKNMFSLTVSAT